MAFSGFGSGGGAFGSGGAFGTSKPAFGSTAPASGFGTTSSFGSTSTPAFGAPANTGTGAFGSTGGGGGFGAFGKPAAAQPTAFGMNSFGSNTNTGGGIFGSTNTAAATPFSTGLSGASKPAFGASSTMPSTGFGGGAFGSTTNTSAWGAGANATANQPSPFSLGGSSTLGLGSGAFGAGSNTTGAFGAKPATSTGFGSAFGSPAGGTTSGIGFGTSSNLFPGQQQQQSQPQTGAFGSTTGAFGATGTSTGFGMAGMQQQQQQQGGTGNPPFNPLQIKENVTKGHQTVSVINHLQVISGMPAYQTKSVDELRFEDYMRGNKGGKATGAFGTGAFGAATPAGSSPFGASATVNTGLGGAFGSTQQQSGFGGFGAGAFGSTAGTTPGGAFGAAAQQGQQSPFGGTTTGAFGSTPAGGSAFGSTGGTQSGFGGAFGAQNAGFGTSSAFGKPATGGAFGATTGGFGTAPSAFGSSSSTPGAFGSGTTGGAFGAPGGTGAFGAKPAFGAFGSQQTGQSGGTGAFGSTMGAFGAPAGGTGFGSAFGNTSTGGAFGSPSGQQQTAPAFGSTGFGGFGAAPTATTGFGSTGFGTNTANGNTAKLFGSTTTGFGGFGSSTPSTGAFGTSSPAAGSGATGSSGFGGFGGFGGLGVFGSTTAAAPTAATSTGGFGGLGGFGTAGMGAFGTAATQQQQQKTDNKTGFGGFGGFGSPTQQQQPASGSGGFGTLGGFGSNSGAGGFGSGTGFGSTPATGTGAGAGASGFTGGFGGFGGFGGLSGGFGQPAAGGFGTQPQQQQQQQQSAASGFGQFGGFGTLQSTSSQQQQQQQLQQLQFGAAAGSQAASDPSMQAKLAAANQDVGQKIDFLLKKQDALASSSGKGDNEVTNEQKKGDSDGDSGPKTPKSPVSANLFAGFSGAGTGSGPRTSTPVYRLSSRASARILPRDLRSATSPSIPSPSLATSLSRRISQQGSSSGSSPSSSSALSSSSSTNRLATASGGGGGGDGRMRTPEALSLSKSAKRLVLSSESLQRVFTDPLEDLPAAPAISKQQQQKQQQHALNTPSKTATSAAKLILAQSYNNGPGSASNSQLPPMPLSHEVQVQGAAVGSIGMRSSRGDVTGLTPNSSSSTTATPYAEFRGRTGDASITPVSATLPRPPTLERVGYFTSPDMAVLKRMSSAELSAVKHFAVYRPNIGKIEWEGVTDVRGLDLDRIVRIEKKEVFVYEHGDIDEEENGDGDKDGKESKQEREAPPVGEGLNKPAVITLYNVFPKHSASETKKREYVRKLEQFCEASDAEFISYDMDRGEWIFAVKHFSRYGIDDSDDDDDEGVERAREREHTAGAKMGTQGAGGSVGKVRAMPEGVTRKEEQEEQKGMDERKSSDAPAVDRVGTAKEGPSFAAAPEVSMENIQKLRQLLKHRRVLATKPSSASSSTTSNFWTSSIGSSSEAEMTTDGRTAAAGEGESWLAHQQLQTEELDDYGSAPPQSRRRVGEDARTTSTAAAADSFVPGAAAAAMAVASSISVAREASSLASQYNFVPTAEELEALRDPRSGDSAYLPQSSRAYFVQNMHNLSMKTSPCMELMLGVKRKYARQAGILSSGGEVTASSAAVQAELLSTTKPPSIISVGAAGGSSGFGAQHSKKVAMRDFALGMGRSFRVGWAPDGRIAFPSGMSLQVTAVNPGASMRNQKPELFGEREGEEGFQPQPVSFAAIHVQRVLIVKIDPLRWQKTTYGVPADPLPLSAGALAAEQRYFEGAMLSCLLSAKRVDSSTATGRGSMKALVPPYWSNPKADPADLDAYNRFLKLLNDLIAFFCAILARSSHCKSSNYSTSGSGGGGAVAAVDTSPDWLLCRALELICATYGQEAVQILPPGGVAFGASGGVATDVVVPCFEERDGISPAVWERRRVAVSRWLETVSSIEVPARVSGVDDGAGGQSDATYERIFSLLSCHRLEDAVSLAEAASLPRLALILSQMDSPESAVSVLIRRQLDLWRYTDAQRTIPLKLWNVYRVISATVVSFDDSSLASSTGAGVGAGAVAGPAGGSSILPGLGWVRAVGMLFWYCSNAVEGPGEDEGSDGVIPAPLVANGIIGTLASCLETFRDLNALQQQQDNQPQQQQQQKVERLVDAPVSAHVKNADPHGANVNYPRVKHGLYSLLELLYPTPLKDSVVEDSFAALLDGNAFSTTSMGESESEAAEMDAFERHRVSMEAEEHRCRLIEALRPEGYTRDALDCRSSFLLLNLLECADIASHQSSLSGDSDNEGGVDGDQQEGGGGGGEGTGRRVEDSNYADIVRAGMIFQLLSVGLWRWAVFVAMQVADDTKRTDMVKQLTTRFAGAENWELSAPLQLDQYATASQWKGVAVSNSGRGSAGKAGEEEGGGDALEDNRFLTDVLGVPVEWVHEATAFRCAQSHNYERQVSYLNYAGQQRSATAVLCLKIAPRVMLSSSDASHTLLTLLESMEPHWKCTSDRGTGIRGMRKTDPQGDAWLDLGDIFLAYLRVREAIQAGGTGGPGSGGSSSEESASSEAAKKRLQEIATEARLVLTRLNEVFRSAKKLHVRRRIVEIRESKKKKKILLLMKGRTGGATAVLGGDERGSAWMADHLKSLPRASFDADEAHLFVLMDNLSKYLQDVVLRASALS